MKFVILFLPRTEIRATRAPALRVSLKNMNGSRVKAISRFRSAFSPEAIALPPKADMCGAARDVRFGPILLQKSAMTGAWRLARTYSS
jgi:hypothetical protein